PDDFRTFWTDRQRLHRILTDLVLAGIEEGELVEVDPEIAALLIASFDEGIQKRVRYQRGHRRGRGHPFSHVALDVEEAADLTASTVLRGLVRRSASLATLARAARELDDLQVLG